MTRGPGRTASTSHRIAPDWVPQRKRPGRRSKLIWGAVAVMAVVVVGLVLYQVLGSSSPPPKVTITSVRWTVSQGTMDGGQGWFGPNQFNYTGGDGYPLNVSPGATFGTSWAFINYDQYNHTIMNVTASAPFRVIATQPGVPVPVPAGYDDGVFLITIQAPDTPGVVSPLFLNVTIG